MSREGPIHETQTSAVQEVPGGDVESPAKVAAVRGGGEVPSTSKTMRPGPVTDGEAGGMVADPLVDAKSAAEYLGLVGVVKHPAQAVRAMCRKRQLTSTRVCGKFMVRRSWLDAYLDRNLRLAKGVQ